MYRVKPIMKISGRGKDGLAPLYVEYRYDREHRTLITTGRKILPVHWNEVKSEVRYSHPDHAELNQLLRSLKRKIEGIADKAALDNISPTVVYVKAKLEDEVAFKAVHKPSAEAILNEWIESKVQDVSKSVITDYRALKKHLLSFAAKRKAPLELTDLNEQLYENFKRYLENDVIVGNGKKGMMKSTVGKQIKNLKVFLRFAAKHGHIKPVDLSEFKKPTDTSEHVYVSSDELDKIMETDLTKYPELKPIRDLFIIGCETGLRFSDLQTLNKKHFGSDYITKLVRKTGSRVIIPISPRLRKLMQRLKGEIPPAPHNNTFNKHIKKVCLLAGLNKPIPYWEKRGTRKYEMTAEKYMLVSSHTCRRSFCTNQFLLGIGLPPYKSDKLRLGLGMTV